MRMPFGTGAVHSEKDPRTVKHHEVVAMAGAPLIKGGIVYDPSDIEHQHKVGICTAISLVQNREKVNKKKYSPEFQYLLQKKIYDGKWDEGSSILSALKVGKSYGFLPAPLWTYTTEQDRLLSYDQYIAKLRAIPDSEVDRLIGLCVDKIKGYAAVDVNDPQAIASAISTSEAGILCMYGCGSTWWTPSWLPQDINPLRKPLFFTSRHAIGMTAFDYTSSLMQKLANTWGYEWDVNGSADINYSNYKMIEAWSILSFPPVIAPFKFNNNLWFGMSGPDVLMLQKRLGVYPQTGFFGFITLSAVIDYQKARQISPALGFVGEKTRTSLNNA